MTLTRSFEAPGEVQREETRYFVGLDLGQSNDSTAIAAVQRKRWMRSSEVHASDPVWTEERPTVYRCGYLERLPLHTSYPAVVNHVIRLLQRPLWHGNADLVIDQTGVGRPVVDLFTAAGVAHIPVTITGGDSETREGRSWRVPKMQLVSGVQALLHEGRLHIHRELREAPTLVKELQDFRVNFTASGHLTFGAREGKHDDLVLALALAVWRSRQRVRAMKQIIGSPWMGR